MNDKYEILNSEINSLLSDENNFITNSSNLVAHLFYSLENVSWVGLYFITNNELLLGPFAGKPACTRLPYGKGVCWASVQQRATVIVEDVHKFPNHIACDAANNSEIVVPLIRNGKVFGVLDLDSLSFGRFNNEDKIGLENIAKILIESSDIDKLEKFYKE